ncbi:MAG TPA: hypothetical protein VMW52_11630 [Phycisphaerae bacterium]|nr:hypothetical protein [Phycisphaerae bacterium]
MAALATITCTVRGGGLGAGAWVALISGTDPTYHLARRFVRGEDHRSRSHRSGQIHFHLQEPGIYEVRRMMDHSRSIAQGEWGGFFRLEADGALHAISRGEALNAAAALDADRAGSPDPAPSPLGASAPWRPRRSVPATASAAAPNAQPAL